MEKYFEILTNCSLFNKIDEKDFKGMLTCLGAKVISFDKKETVFAEGQPGKYLGIVLKGRVQVIQIDYYGNRSILSTAHSGSVFSEAFACAGTESMPVSVVAAEPSEIMLIDCNKILYPCSNACNFHHQLLYNLTKNLAQKNIMLHKKAEITSKRTTREKLMAYLMFQAKEQGSSSFEIPFDRQELADYLLVDRSGLSAEISKLRKEKVLTSQKNKFKLL